MYSAMRASIVVCRHAAAMRDGKKKSKRPPPRRKELLTKASRKTCPGADLPADYKYKYIDDSGNTDNGEDDHEVPEGAPADEQPMAVQQDGSCGLWAIACTILCAVDIIESKQSMHNELAR